MKTATYILTIAYIALFVTVTNTQAYAVPTFPTCLNPQGHLKTSNTGTHGVPGDYATYKGIDSVYQVEKDSNVIVIQCLCPENGSGVQTNWWKVSGLTPTEIDELKQKGYVYVPNGIVWGLDDAPYIANNVPYSCLAKGGGESSSSSSSSSSNTTNNTTNNVTNNITQVFGLANTGNMKSIYFYTVSGLFLIALGIYSLRANKN